MTGDRTPGYAPEQELDLEQRDHPCATAPAHRKGERRTQGSLPGLLTP